MKHLLIVDDELGSRESLRSIFEKQYRLSLASGAAQAARLLSEAPVDLVLLDVMMPEKDGVTFLQEIREIYPHIPVIMVSASTALRPVIEAIRVGAYDYVTKPFDVAEIRHMVARALESSSLQRRVEVLQTEVSQEYPIDGIVGDAPAYRRALDDARKAAETDSTILIAGESGTGKELVARCVHAWSSRREEPFVAVHCAAIPEPLMESELFGYEKGAFTHAEKQKPGRFDLAGSGTLFFDEVSEMTPSTQVKLLRVLQEREFMRIGGTRVIRTNARILAATNKDLREEVKARRFRDDLFYRISVVPVRLPPLRERREDIPRLARHFLDYFRRSVHVVSEDFAPETLQLLEAYAWPGNVRELKNIIERMVVLHGGTRILQPQFLPEELLPPVASAARSPAASPPLPAGPVTLAGAVSGFERQLIERALAETGGVQTAAAQALGTTRRILRYRMHKLNILPANGHRKAPPAPLSAAREPPPTLPPPGQPQGSAGGGPERAAEGPGRAEPF